MIIIAVIVPITIIGLIGSLCIFLYCRRRCKARQNGRQDNYADNNDGEINVHVNVGIPIQQDALNGYSIIGDPEAPVSISRESDGDSQAQCVNKDIKIKDVKAFKGTCTICHEPNKSNPPCVKFRKCEHVFHKSCVDEMMQNVEEDNKRCPNCRIEV